MQVKCNGKGWAFVYFRRNVNSFPVNYKSSIHLLSDERRNCQVDFRRANEGNRISVCESWNGSIIMALVRTVRGQVLHEGHLKRSQNSYFCNEPKNETRVIAIIVIL